MRQKHGDAIVQCVLGRRVGDIDASLVEAEYRRIVKEVKGGGGMAPSARSEAPGVATANAVLRNLSAIWNPAGEFAQTSRDEIFRRTTFFGQGVRSVSLKAVIERLVMKGSKVPQLGRSLIFCACPPLS